MTHDEMKAAALVYRADVKVPLYLDPYVRELVGDRLLEAFEAGCQLGYARGQEELRERAAQEAGVWEDEDGTSFDIGEDIHSLPIQPVEGEKP